MEPNYSESIVRNLIAKILCQKDIFPEDYEIIIDTLQKRNDENIYLIQALRYLNLSSDIIELLIKSYETKELFFFLMGNDNQNLKLNLTNNLVSNFQPMTKEKALLLKFNDPSVILPDENEFNVVNDRFYFFDENQQKYYTCERKYLIDHTGSVVDFLGETVAPKEDCGFNQDNLYSGVLGEDFFNS